MRYLLYFSLLGLLALAACEPYQVDDVALGDAPTAAFSYTFLDSNQVVVSDESTGGFVRLWDFGNEKNSTQAVDTVLYLSQGTFTIRLTVSGQGGNASSEQSVNILRDAPTVCDEISELLTNGCGEADSAAWVFTQEAGAVGIGPTELSVEFFSSGAGTLQPEQYDDQWVFSFVGSRHQYYNNGETIDPAQGFEPVAFTPPTDIVYTLSPGTGYQGTTQIILPEGSFIGVKNSGPVYDIIEISEDRMVLLSQQTDGTGWFTQVFVR
jgi:PKD repeat protein